MRDRQRAIGLEEAERPRSSSCKEERQRVRAEVERQRWRRGQKAEVEAKRVSLSRGQKGEVKRVSDWLREIT